MFEYYLQAGELCCPIRSINNAVLLLMLSYKEAVINAVLMSLLLILFFKEAVINAVHRRLLLMLS